MWEAAVPCPHLEANTEGATCCTLAAQLLGAVDSGFVKVHSSACNACNRVAPARNAFNPVISSLVHQSASRIIELGGIPGCDVSRAMQIRFKLLPRLRKVEQARPDTRASRTTWAVGMITAPRAEPTIGAALRSLRRSGFDDIHVFAEPGVTLPDEFAHLPISQHGRRIGTLGNFYTALMELYMLHPDSAYFAIFQDDIEVADGLFAWCDAEPWPAGAGLISLYTPRVLADTSTGWRTLRMGFYRTFGALAFVFHRDTLLKFLSDPQALAMRRTFRHADDGVVGDWASRTGVGIAYHTPSLIQHVGHSSATEGHGIGRHGIAEAVDSIKKIERWTPSDKLPGKVGLVGWNTASGLGYQNRDLAIHGGIDRWLIPQHPHFATLPPPEYATCRMQNVSLGLGDDDIRAWMDGLDWVLFVEIPYIHRFAQHARGLGISVAHVPNWELSDPQVDWINYVDLILCPTAHTHQVFLDWRVTHRQSWDLATVPWPIDIDRFPFRERRRCERYVFINGTGGCRATRADGSPTPYRRKGMEVFIEAARHASDLSFLLYSQVPIDLPIPANVEVRSAPADNARLYDEGDVCVQPSHWEGLGLTLLECQASGMPLITTDAAPMNELRPFRVIPTTATEVVSLFGFHPFPSCLIDSDDLVRVLREVAGTDIADASHAARSNVVSHRSWKQAGPMLRTLLTH